VLLDTSVLVAAERGHLMLPAGRDTGIAAITAAEFFYGVHRAHTDAQRNRRRQFIENVLQRVFVVPFDIVTARLFAGLRADLEAAGTRIGLLDLQIAASALATARAVVTLNTRDFQRVPGLNVLSIEVS
jgi:tRNA(fMet)-specific endonuclease VapC